MKVVAINTCVILMLLLCSACQQHQAPTDATYTVFQTSTCESIFISLNDTSSLLIGCGNTENDYAKIKSVLPDTIDYFIANDISEGGFFNANQLIKDYNVKACFLPYLYFESQNFNLFFDTLKEKSVQIHFVDNVYPLSDKDFSALIVSSISLQSDDNTHLHSPIPIVMLNSNLTNFLYIPSTMQIDTFSEFVDSELLSAIANTTEPLTIDLAVFSSRCNTSDNFFDSVHLKSVCIPQHYNATSQTLLEHIYRSSPNAQIYNGKLFGTLYFDDNAQLIENPK